jgi:hypothetical protein
MGTDNNKLNINHLIAYYGSKGNLAKDLEITNSKLTALLKDRRKLLYYLPEFIDYTKLTAGEILNMILSEDD